MQVYTMYILRYLLSYFMVYVLQLNVVNLNYTKNVSNPNELFNLTHDEFTLPSDHTFSLIPVSEKFNGSYHDFPVEVWNQTVLCFY